MKDLMEKNEKELYRAVSILGLGFWLLYGASVYKTKAGATLLAIYLYPQSMIFAIFGIFHGASVWKLYKAVYSYDRYAKWISYIHFAGQCIVYTAFFNIVLFPLSGIGILEWIFVTFIIFSDFFGQITQKKVSKQILLIGQHPLHMIIFGIFLFIVKITIYYFSPDNIYDETFMGNQTARSIIAIVGGVTIFFLLSRLNVHVFHIKMEKNLFQKIGAIIKNILTHIAQIIVASFGLPVLLIAIAIFFAGGFIFAGTIRSNIVNMLEPLLLRILSTGENKIPITKFYGISQLVTIIIMLFYFLMSYHNLKETAQKKAEDNYIRMKEAYPDLPQQAFDKLEADKDNVPLLVAGNEKVYNYIFTKTYEEYR